MLRPLVSPVHLMHKLLNNPRQLMKLPPQLLDVLAKLLDIFFVLLKVARKRKNL